MFGFRETSDLELFGTKNATNGQGVVNGVVTTTATSHSLSVLREFLPASHRIRATSIVQPNQHRIRYLAFVKMASKWLSMMCPKSTTPQFNVAKSMASKSKKNVEEIAHKDLKLNWFSMWCLGIAIVIGGQYFSWNEGLSAGFGSCLISTIIMGLGYLCLCMCNAELTSSMPFAGGAYGLARVSLGLWQGFVVGCCEAVEYIVYVSSAALSLGTMIQEASGTSRQMIPVFCLIFYVISTGLNIIGGSLFWHINTCLALVSSPKIYPILFILLYFLYSNPVL